MMVDSPMPMEEMRNRSGSRGVYHSESILAGSAAYSVPSVDWCSVESVMPAMTMGMVKRWIVLTMWGLLKR